VLLLRADRFGDRAGAGVAA